MKVNTLENYFSSRIDSGLGNIDDTVEDMIRDANLIAIGKMITPKIELAFTSINESCGSDATSFMASSERGENIEKSASFENVSGRNNTSHKLKTNDKTPNKNLDEISEFLVLDTVLDRQPHTQHMVTRQRVPTSQFPEILTRQNSTHENNHYTNIITCRHKYHKTIINQRLNIHQDIKLQTQTTPSHV